MDNYTLYRHIAKLVLHRVAHKQVLFLPKNLNFSKLLSRLRFLIVSAQCTLLVMNFPYLRGRSEIIHRFQVVHVGLTMLHEVGWTFEAGSNLSQHLPTWCLNVRGQQHVASNNVGWCWANMLASFKQALTVQRQRHIQLFRLWNEFDYKLAYI